MTSNVKPAKQIVNGTFCTLYIESLVKKKLVNKATCNDNDNDIAISVLKQLTNDDNDTIISKWIMI